MLFLYPWCKINEKYYFFLREAPFKDELKEYEMVDVIGNETEGQKRFLDKFPGRFLIYEGEPKNIKVSDHVWLMFDHFEYFNYEGDDDLQFTVEAARIMHIYNQ